MGGSSQVPGLAKAKLILLDSPNAVSDKTKHINVQFNPSSLKVSLANTLKSDSNGGDSGSAAQFVDKSSSSLSIELMFDTTVTSEEAEANSDVRVLTQKIADAFMKPVEGSDGKLRAPVQCRFQWGAFVFVGMIGTYNETLDFFSPEGIPLRAKLGLTLKEDKYQFERDTQVKALRGSLPSYSFNNKQKTSKARTLFDALKELKKDVTNFRSSAINNGVENVRQVNSQPLQIDKEDKPIPETRQMDGTVASSGFKNGKSDTVGSRIPGAFSQSNKGGLRGAPLNKAKQQRNNITKNRQDIRDN